MTKSAKKLRLDQLVHQLGLAETRERARALIMAAHVRVEGQVVDRPGTAVDPGATVEVTGSQPFVGRGGLKLAHALDHFGIDPAGLTALDVGASTGGFTDCLLQRGAVRVFAVDVGYGQLDYRLRRDPRVVVMERVNAHYPFELEASSQIAVVDVSFISLTKVLPNVLPHLAPGSAIVCLVKPQFEAGRGEVGRGGIVRDPAVHGAVLANVSLWAIDQDLRVLGIAPSPVLGDKGNREFLIHLHLD